MARTKDLEVKVDDFTPEGLEKDARGKNSIKFTDLKPEDFGILSFEYQDDKLIVTDIGYNKLIVSNPSAIKYAKDKDNTLTDLIAENLIDNLNVVEYNTKKKAYVGTIYNDYFESDTADEKFIGGIGKNTFYYSKAKGGNDVIELTNKENLVLDLTTYIKSNQISLRYANKNKDLVLYIDENNSITLKNYVAKNVVGTGSITLKTQDNTEGVLLDSLDIVTTITDASNYTGTRLNDCIYAVDAQEKQKKGKHVDLVFKGGAGNDTILSSKFADKVTGGAGKNTYLYTDMAQLDGDKIYLTKGEKALIDIGTFTATGYEVVGKDLVVTVTDGNDTGSFTIMNFGTKDVTNNKTKKTLDTSYVLLNDSTAETEGSIDLREEILVKSDKGTFHNDYIDRSTSKKGLTINGGAGDDTIIGTDKKDTIKAGTGTYENITGGKGNDKLYGSTTENSETTFNFYKGDGVDTIYNATKTDKIMIKDNQVSKDDLRYVKNGNDLEIFYTPNYDSNDKIIVKNYYKTPEADRIKNLQAYNKLVDLSNVDVVDAKSGKINASKNDDVLVGSAKADTLNADTHNNVIIVGEKGNDKLYASSTADTNTTFRFNLGDGKDTVYSGKGDDTLVFDEFSLADIGFYKGTGKSADDLIIKYSTKDSVTIKDYYKTTNTITHITTKEATFDIADLIASQVLITGSGDIYGNDYDNIIIGSDGDDTIKGFDGNDEIYGNGGTDTIYGGVGDDTIHIAKGNTSTDIYFESGNGSDTLTGLENASSVSLYSEGLLHSVPLGEGMQDYNYFTGTKNGDDLVLNMNEDSQTFTVENFYKQGVGSYRINSAYIDGYLCDESGNLIFDNKVKDHLYLAGDIKDITDDSYTETGDNKLLKVSGNNKTVTLSGDNNGLALTGTSATVNINGYDSKVYVYNNDDNYVNKINIGTVTQTEISGNRVHTYGRTNIEIAKDGFEGNYIKMEKAYNATVNTSEGGRTIVDIDAKNSVQNYIYSKGSDTLMLGNGDYRVSLYANKDGYDEKTLVLSSQTGKTELFKHSSIYGVAVTGKTDITQQFDDNVTLGDVMFEHHNSANNYLNINYLDENGTLLNSTLKRLIMEGTWTDDVFDLNTKEVGDRVTVTAENETSSVVKKLSEMTQLVNMGMGDYNSESEDFAKELMFDEKGQNGFLDNRAGLYIIDELKSHNDLYSGYEFSMGKAAINDAGGTDKLSLDMARNDYRFFIDFSKSDDAAVDDLLIFSHTTDDTDGLSQYLASGNLSSVDEYVQIKNTFTKDGYKGAGVMETIDDNGDKTWTVAHVEGYMNDIKSDVVGWINGYNNAYHTYCDTVTEALADGQASDTQLNTLYNIYCRTDEQWGAY